MKIPENPVVYVTKDRERAEGIAESDTYSIVTGNGTDDTLEVLKKVETEEVIDANDASLLVFKNTKQIEELAQKKGWNLLNPSAELAEQIENKISQIVWLGDLAKLLPPHEITVVKNVHFDPKEKNHSLILQWAHSHTGEGTLLVTKAADLKTLQGKFPDRDVRVTSFIKGPMFTANIVVGKETTLMGNISCQITGLSPFTDNEFSTIGNDWSIPFNTLSETKIAEFEAIAEQIATRMRKSGWLGLFGIDVIYDEERDNLYLIEINARQPASTTYESQLQQKAREQGVPGITTFEAHLLAITDKALNEPLIQINDGAQIIQRITKTTKEVSVEKLVEAGYNVITYPNTKINSDLARIQSTKGILESYKKLNKRGKEIVELLK